MDEFWSQEFPITSLTRDDLVTAGIPRTVVEKLTDDEMRRIASKMEDLYCDHGYWEDVAFTAQVLVAEKAWSDESSKSPS